MKVIGITGGIGSGKTQVMNYIKSHACCRVIFADEVAHLVKEPGTECYKALVDLLGSDILEQDMSIRRDKMAEIIFADGQILGKINALIHPAVKTYIVKAIQEEKAAGNIKLLFVEAALLIESGYMDICDEIWYIYAEENIRKQRLKESRGYDIQKIDGIMKSQMSDEFYRKHCKFVINNSGNRKETYKQIKTKLEEYK